MQPESRAESRAELGVDSEPKFQIQKELQQELVQVFRAELGAELRAELGAELKRTTLYCEIVKHLFNREMSRQELANALSIEKISGYMNRIVNKLLEQALIERTIPEKQNHPAQKFMITERGRMFLALLETLKKERINAPQAAGKSGKR